MRSLFALSVILTTLFALPTPTTGQDQEGSRRGVLIRVDGDVSTPADAEYSLVVVVRGHLDARGRIGTVVVVDGTADFTGADVDGILMLDGRARLLDNTVVSGDVQLVDAELDVAEGSRVLGQVEEGARHQIFRGFWIFGALFALGTALALVLGGLLMALLAPHGVRVAGQAMTDEPLRVLVWTLGTWLLLPLGAVFVIPTVVGIPLGVGIFVFVLPTLAFLGYLISAIRLGDGLVAAVRKSVEQPRPFVAALTGTVALLLLGLAPWIGAFVPILAGAWGSGALLLTLVRAVGLRPGPVLDESVLT